MKKKLNYEVVDLVESYNFHIKFISLRGHTKCYDFLKRTDPRRVPPCDTTVGTL
jgi:glutaredoxin-related protein